MDAFICEMDDCSSPGLFHMDGKRYAIELLRAAIAV